MNNQTVNSVAKLNCETFEVHFGGFEALPAVKGEDAAESPEFTCFGHQWRVVLYPGGNTNSNDGRVSLFLLHCSPESIEVQATFTVAQSKKKFAAIHAAETKQFHAPSGDGDSSWGTSNFARRSAMIEALQYGALVIEVQLKQTGPSASSSLFVPGNQFCQNALKKFMSEESADIVFEVSKDQVKDGRETRKRAKASPTTFYAHRFVLPESGALAEACKSSSDLTPVPITGVDPEIFRHLLFYLYGGAIDDEVLKENAKDIVDAADKFGVVELKLAAEAAFVSATAFTVDNIMDALLYADAKNCPLLKEAAVDFLVENGIDAVKRLSFQDVPGSVVADVLTAMNRGKEVGSDSGGSGNLSTARVSALRLILHEKGLDVDGSREVLIARLEEHSAAN